MTSGFNSAPARNVNNMAPRPVQKFHPVCVEGQFVEVTELESDKADDGADDDFHQGNRDFQAVG